MVEWYGLELFFVCDYLWRHEKHINRESYIFRDGVYPVSMLVDCFLYPFVFRKYAVGMLVGIISYLLFFGNRLGYVVLYPLIFCRTL